MNLLAHAILAYATLDDIDGQRCTGAVMADYLRSPGNRCTESQFSRKRSQNSPDLEKASDEQECSAEGVFFAKDSLE